MQLYQAGNFTQTVDCCNYVTMFHPRQLATHRVLTAMRYWVTDVDNGLHGLLNACL